MALVFIACLVALGGCASSDKGSGNLLPTDKYVAVEETFMSTCTLINGSYGLPPHITLPVMFDYDGSLNGSNPADGSGWDLFRPDSLDGYYPAVNDSLTVLAGTYYYRDLSPGDTSTGMRVRGVYSLPYAFESGFVLRDVDRNGTVYGSYDNESIVLKVGEHWTSPVQAEISGGNGVGLDQQPFSWAARFNTTWSIANLGVIDKSNLTRYNNSAGAFGYTQVFTGADPAEQ